MYDRWTEERVIPGMLLGGCTTLTRSAFILELQVVMVLKPP